MLMSPPPPVCFQGTSLVAASAGPLRGNAQRGFGTLDTGLLASELLTKEASDLNRSRSQITMLAEQCLQYFRMEITTSQAGDLPTPQLAGKRLWVSTRN